MNANDKTMEDVVATARRAIEIAKRKGAAEVAASASCERSTETRWRDGKLEKIAEATTRGLSLELYVDGRYGAMSTSDLRPAALDNFVEGAVALVRALAKDPHRALPDPALCGQVEADLQLEDPKYDDVSPADRRRAAEEAEAGSRAAKGATAIVSVTAGVEDGRGVSCRVHSSGFEGRRSATSFRVDAEVSARDPDGRKPEDWHGAGARFRGELPSPTEVGRVAAERALARIGAKKGASEVLTMAVDNRAAGRLISFLLASMSASSLQQKRSFLDGKLGAAIGSPRLDVVDDPLLPRGLGSRHYDGEGLKSQVRPIFEGGVLRAFYVDNYYGRKLGMAPTTRGPSNHTWKVGAKSQAALLADLKEGILVTGFLGGNSNGTTGDFSLGVQGFRVRKGVLAEPVSEMNIAGNHLELWKRLAAVGNDPYPWSTLRTPTLVFEGVQFAGV